MGVSAMIRLGRDLTGSIREMRTDRVVPSPLQQFAGYRAPRR